MSEDYIDDSTCWKCNKRLSEADDIINPYDEHTYCLDCNDDVCSEWEEKGYVWDSEHDKVSRKLWYCPKCKTYPDKVLYVSSEPIVTVMVFNPETEEYEEAGGEEQENYNYYPQAYDETCPECESKLIEK